MKRFFLCLGLSVAVSTAALFADAKTVDELTKDGSAAEKGLAIAGELRARNAGYKDLGGDVEMVLKDSAGGESKRRFSIKVMEQPEPGVAQYSLVVFDNPADVKGTSLLSHAKLEGEDDQWLFMPAVGRVKRVAAQNKSASFVGSEFSYEDLTGNDARKYSWKLVGKKSCGGDECLELEGTPKDPASAYSRRVITLDTKELRIQTIDFYDRKGSKLKTLTYGDYKLLGSKFWRAHAWTMKNHQSGKSTTLTFTSMKVGNGFSASDFSTGKLGGGR
jgi:outer membrane lipoprotein-sorting protein